MYSSMKSCLKIDESSITELFSCNKGIRQGDSLSPVLLSLFMNDLPQYFRDHHCPGVMLGRHSLNCRMYADDLLVLSPSPEGLQKSINVIKKHAEEWKLKVNTKKSNNSGNGQTKNNENFPIWIRNITYRRQTNIFGDRNDFVWSLYLRKRHP